MSAATTSVSYQAMPLPPPIMNPTYAYQVTSPLQPHTASTYGYQAPPLPPLPRQPWALVPTPMPHQLPPSVGKPPGFFYTCSDGCAFCTQKGHRLHECPAAEEYVNSRRVLIVNHQIHLPNGQLVPNNGTGRGIKASIDNWLTTQYPSQVVAPTAWVEEVVEAHILQIVEFSSPLPDDESEDEAMDIFEVFAAQKRKREGKAAKLPELIKPAVQTMPAPPPTIQAKLLTTQNKPGPQYCYQATVEDQCLVLELQDWLMGGKLIQTTPAHILAASPTIRKELVEKL
jgi:hypothetical protein